MVGASSAKQMRPPVEERTRGRERTSGCPRCRDRAALPPRMDSAPGLEAGLKQADTSGQAARIRRVVCHLEQIHFKKKTLQSLQNKEGE